MQIELKDKLFTNISHDFKTPLTLIMSPLDTILETETDPANIARLKIIKDNAERLHALVNQIVDIRKIDAGEITVCREKSSLANLIDSVIYSFSEYARQKNIAVLFENTDPDPVFEFDIDKMEKVVYNLISNALKYTESGGSVIVSLTRNSESICKLTVADTGIGIPPESLDHIFERYYQVPGSKSEQIGSGIGLTIVKEYVELHDGTVRVESQPGQGTVFTIELPIVNRKEADMPQTGAIAHDKPQLLIVEDSVPMTEYLLAELSETYSVCCEHTGEDGLKKTMELMPDLIILDLMLPGMDGIQVCRQLKNDVQTSHIPVVILTAKGTNEARLQSYGAKADVFLQKPFSLRVLKEVILNEVEKQKRLKESYNKLSLFDGKKDLTPNEKLLKKIQETILSRISDPDLDAQYVSKEMGMSYVTFYRKLQSLTGTNVNTYIRNIRLQKAASMLAQEGYNVTDVMYAVGFNNRSYFAKCFKDYYHVSPKQYIIEHQKNIHEEA